MASGLSEGTVRQLDVRFEIEAEEDARRHTEVIGELVQARLGQG
jgi:hypothetical protein